MVPLVGLVRSVSITIRIMDSVVHRVGDRLADLVVLILALLGVCYLRLGGNSLLLLCLVLIDTEDLLNDLSALCADGLSNRLTLLLLTCYFDGDLFLGAGGLEGWGAYLSLDDRVLNRAVSLCSNNNRSSSYYWGRGHNRVSYCSSC